jgi:hypothetical protein
VVTSFVNEPIAEEDIEVEEDADWGEASPLALPLLATTASERYVAPATLRSSGKEERTRLMAERVSIEEAVAFSLLSKDLRSRPRPRVAALRSSPRFDLPEFIQTQGECPSLNTMQRAQQREAFTAEAERSAFKKLHVREAKPTRVDVIADDSGFVQSLCKAEGSTRRLPTGGLQTSHTMRAALAHPGAYGLRGARMNKKKMVPWRGAMEVHLWAWELEEHLWHCGAAMCAVPECPQPSIIRSLSENLGDLQSDLDVDLSELDLYRDE